ncbi:dipeptide ABC transporter ATP-binding protein [Auritidibacter ignavus]|uniref:dipeptide ABC transporter ATP-binding protein n=1 Tax=Auritidibacter ignavus TaxID=678932 RepID=UPI00109CDB5E|nr:ABC transporter ATP-binding protein [Auritidibacter ignavus]
MTVLLENASSSAPKPTTPLLQLEGLKVDYRSGSSTTPALHGVDFAVYPGQRISVVGESGSGKSTLALSLLGLLPPEASIRDGKLSWGDTPIALRSDRSWQRLRGQKIGLIPQDPGVSLNPVYTIGHQLIEAIRAHQKVPKALARQRALELLDQVGLDAVETRFDQYPHQLSGGMRQRVLIAIALAPEPDLLIADEPTSALDATVQRKILDLLDSIISERDIALVLITHDLAVAAQRTETTVVMHHGNVMEIGDTGTILNTPTHSYTQRLVAAADSLHRSTHIRPPLDVETEVLVQVRGLKRHFAQPKATSRRHDASTLRTNAVDGIDFEIRRGETLALVGESGSGKSTTARLVLGLDTPTEGTVTFDGEPVHHLSGRRWRQLRRRAQLIYQNPFASLNPRWSLEQIITEPLRAFKVGNRAERRATAETLLDQVGLPATFGSRLPRELSGGQRQRVAIARALALSPDFVVCDEPVSALDVSVQEQVLDLMLDLQAEHELTYLFITHDLAVVRRLAHRVAVMNQGKIVETGTTQEVFAHPQEEYTASLLRAVEPLGSGD